jgi:ERCC4-type nuclease
MFEFREWHRDDIKRIYITSGCPEKVWIEQLSRTGLARVRCKLSSETASQTKRISEAGFDFTKGYETWEHLVDALYKIPGNHVRYGAARTKTSHSHSLVNSPATVFSKIDVRSQEVLANQSLEFSIDSAPFKSSTLKNCTIVIDTREPESVFKKFCEGKVQIQSAALEIGDILLKSEITGDHVVIERKTITDFYGAITGEQHRVHSQAERLYQYQQDMANKGVRVLVIWMVEAEQNGNRSLYNTLPKTNQMDGMLNYLIAILGQHVVQTFNLHHLCYLTMKFLQGFFEQELYYPVRTATGSQIDLKKEARQQFKLGVMDSDFNHGVSIPGRKNLFHVLTAFPSIDSRIANSLIESGLVLQDILKLSESELIQFEGIGKAKAKKIFSDFQM